MIEVRILKTDLERYSRGNAVHEGLHVLRKLREAGIPMRGTLGPLVPDVGVLTVEIEGLAVDEYVWSWRSE